MLSFIKNKPEFKQNSQVFKAIILILSIISSVIIFMPVVVCFMSNFSNTLEASDNIYYVLRGILGLSIIFTSVALIIKNNFSFCAIPSLISFIVLLFPFVKVIESFFSAIRRAELFSMTMDYSSYLLQVALYLIFAVLSILTFLYSFGKFKYGIVIMVISVISTLYSVFIAIERYITYLIPLYEVVCFSYSSIVSFIPFLLVISTITKSAQTKEKYIPKRMKQ